MRDRAKLQDTDESMSDPRDYSEKAAWNLEQLGAWHEAHGEEGAEAWLIKGL